MGAAGAIGNLGVARALPWFQPRSDLPMQSNNPAHAPSLIETEQVYADADAGVSHHPPTKDHMGRPIAESWRDALKHDAPWMAASVVLLVFLVGALAGFWGR
jgi:hypothetical protein